MDVQSKHSVKDTYMYLNIYDHLPETDESIVRLMRGYLQRCFNDGMDIDSSRGENNANTMLHRAVLDGKVRIVQALLAQGADYKILNGDKNSAFTLAKSRESMLKVFPQPKAVQISPIQYFDFVQKGDIEGVKLAIQSGNRQLLLYRDADVRSALHHAAEAGSLEIIELLLKQGLELEAKDKDSRTPIFSAAQAGHEKVVEHFLRQGSGRNICDKFKQTPLHVACDMGHLNVVKLLSFSLNKEVLSECIDMTDFKNRKPIDLARNKHKDVFDFLKPICR